MVFRIKICGVTSVSDALAAVEAGADAIGLNFYSGSPRCIGVQEAKLIADAVSAEVDRVGVFVNAPADEIQQICQSAGLRAIQLHGDEPPELLKSLGHGWAVIRARRLGNRGLQAICDDIANCCQSAGFGPDAILIDAAMSGAYGGTGRTVDWSLLLDYQQWLGDVPLVLAGGLTPDNVAEAIQTVRPHAVDVSSGVESSPGIKDAIKMRDFVIAAREAFS